MIENSIEYCINVNITELYKVTMRIQHVVAETHKTIIVIKIT